MHTNDDEYPKIIHRIWFDFGNGENIPKSSEFHVEKCHRMHKDWKVMWWNEKDAHHFVETYFPQYIDIYDRLHHPVQRVDVLRYMILYIYGGMYLDIDITCLKSVDEYLSSIENKKDVVCIPLSQQNTFMKSPLLNNYLMISHPNHPFWMHVLEEWARRCFEEMNWANKYFGTLLTSMSYFFNDTTHLVLYQSGPGLISDIFFNHPEMVHPLPIELFNPKHHLSEYWSCYNRFTEDTILVHHATKTWNSFPCWIYDPQVHIYGLLFFSAIILILFYIVYYSNEEFHIF